MGFTQLQKMHVIWARLVGRARVVVGNSYVRFWLGRYVFRLAHLHFVLLDPLYFCTPKLSSASYIDNLRRIKY